MILGQLRMGARQTNYAPLALRDDANAKTKLNIKFYRQIIFSSILMKCFKILLSFSSHLMTFIIIIVTKIIIVILLLTPLLCDDASDEI